MGRELRRREEKRNKKLKNIEENEDLQFEIKGLTILKVVSSIVLILLVSYYIMAVFITKEIDISEKETETTEKENSEQENSNKILAANIFNQSEETYYVYCYDFNNEDDGVKEAINNNQNPIYKVDTSDGLNSKYVVEENGNTKATTLEELKVTNPTLLVISGDKITEYYEGRTKIISFLTK